MSILQLKYAAKNKLSFSLILSNPYRQQGIIEKALKTLYVNLRTDLCLIKEFFLVIPLY